MLDDLLRDYEVCAFEEGVKYQMELEGKEIIQIAAALCIIQEIPVHVSGDATEYKKSLEPVKDKFVHFVAENDVKFNA